MNVLEKGAGKTERNQNDVKNAATILPQPVY